MVAELLEKHGIVPRSVGDLVDPTGRSPPPLLRAILHGAIDADRFDYLQRDVYYTGVAHGTIDAAPGSSTRSGPPGHGSFSRRRAARPSRGSSSVGR